MTTAPYPTWTRQQALSSLARADYVRTTNAGIVRGMRAMGAQDAASHAADLLRRMPPTLGALPVQRFLEGVPKVGPTKAARMMAHAEIYRVARRIRDLSPRQRELLAKQLEHRCIL